MTPQFLMEKTQKLILVTGGAGFVGSHLCERLQHEGHRVISLDNYFMGSRENHVAGVEYREGHTRDILKHIPETPDIVYHLGEYSRVAASLEEPEVVFDLNMAGTFGVLEFWRKKKCKLVYAGSSTKGVGARDDGVVGRDLAPYTWMKAANTELVANYGRWYSLPYAIVYFYNVYGPRERPLQQYGTLIENWRQYRLRGESLQVRSPGTQRRAFTHVEDTVDGIVLVGEKGEGDNFGIGSDETFSLLEVAEMFGGAIEMLPATSTTRASAEVDSTKTRALGWKPKQHLPNYIKSLKA
jgi:UDP-glucose 4-epimerase